MDMAEASCSSTEPREALARGLLLAALEDLTQEQLKRFCHKLQDAPLDGRSIPRGRLEGADPVDLVDKLTQFYGPEPALDVTRKILKKADARDVASKLKTQRLQRLGPSSSALLSVSEYKKKYREHVLLQHAKVKERNARSVKINKRFTKLLIAPGNGALEDPVLGTEGEPEPERARRSDTHTFNRLFRGDEEGQGPLTVVLQGPAGIGKTMAAKKILYDWAAGKLYHGQVDFAFFVACRELLQRPGACSLADLILDQCPDRVAPLQQMLAHPQRLLFILDGADELPALGAPEAAPCRDPFEATSGLRVLSGLLSQELLPLVRILVTARTVAPGRLRGKLSSPQCAEVRGFSNKDKKKYFFKFFKDEKKAERAYRFVKQNETLFTLCFVPFVCWIVCTVLLQQLKLGQSLARISKTTTSVYLLFIVSTLKSPGADGPRLQRELRKLCLLARDGILKCQAHFSDKDLERLKLQGSQVQTLFLNKKQVLGVLEEEVTYQFIDQSFQEFLAALSYLLEDEGAPGAPAGGVQMLLNSESELRGHLALTTRFLFGLLNAERIGDIEQHFGCVVPGHVKQDTLQWVQSQGRPRVAPGGAERTDKLEHTEEPEEVEEDEEEEEMDFRLELLYCLYETQDDAFVRQALSSLPELVLEKVRFSPMDLEVLGYCVRCSPEGQVLRLVSCGLVAAQEKKKKTLMKRLKGSRATMKQPSVSLLRPLCEAMSDQQCGLSSLTLSCCKLPDAVCRDLSEALKTSAPTLRELSLLQCQLTPAGLRFLSEGLSWPKCQVQTLRMQLLHGIQEAIQYLVIVLRQSPVLTTLDLSGCQLPDPMMSYLCSALEHPACCLKTLSLTSMELSEQSLRELQDVKKAKPDLTIIHPALGTHFQPSEECGTVF